MHDENEIGNFLQYNFECKFWVFFESWYIRTVSILLLQSPFYISNFVLNFTLFSIFDRSIGCSNCVNFVSHFICFLFSLACFHSILISFLFIYFCWKTKQRIDWSSWYFFLILLLFGSCLQFFTDKFKLKNVWKENSLPLFQLFFFRGRFTGKELYGSSLFLFDCFYYMCVFFCFGFHIVWFFHYASCSLSLLES